MICTPRMTIRPLNYYELLSRLYSNVGHVNDEEGRQNVLKYSVEPMKKAPEELHKFYTFWVGEDKGEEVLECGYICPPTEHKVMEVFCYVRPEYQGKGYGSQCLRLTLLSIYRDCNLFNCWLIVDQTNCGAIKLYHKHGFRIWCDIPSSKAYIMGLSFRRFKVL